MRYVLQGTAAESAARAGGKAATLRRLSLELDVPDFFVLSAASFTEAGMKKQARFQASVALETLGAGPFAVRSSGRDEDGAAHAHAGQYETELGVAREDVFPAAERVWRSGFSARVSAYRTARGLDAAPTPPAIIVQRMIQPRAAGVAFSVCPVTGARDVAVINAVAGLADKLVAGEVEGESYRVGAAGEVTRDGASLSDVDCRAVADLARACAAAFGAPQDIEWAFEGERLYLLQCRPITTLAAQAPRIWDNSNIVESYPGIVSTLTFSFAQHLYAHVYRAFSRLMGVPAAQVNANAQVFDNMLGRIDGRVYYDLTNWYRALALFPGFQSNRAFMEQMMGVSEALPPALAARIAPPARDVAAKALDGARLARVAAGLVFHAFALRTTTRRFRDRLDQALSTSNAWIESASLADLAQEYRRIERLLLTRWDAPLINDFLCMIAFGASRKALERWAGAPGLSLHSDVLIGQGDIISAEPARRIRAMGALARRSPDLVSQLAQGDCAALQDAPELAAAFAAYLAKFGDRCVQELKLESANLEDDPRQLLLAIAAAANAPERAAHASVPMHAGLQALFAGRPCKRGLALWLLRRARARVRDRENLRFERTRLFGRARRIFRAMGAHLAATGALAQADDVFHLTLSEVLAAAEGGDASALRSLAAHRRAQDCASSTRRDPPERIVEHGAAHTRAPEPQGESRTGLACCAGITMARVRVITDPRREALIAGEILVARFTDPGWIAVFANAAGVIVERGSLLSHSAIVARELGIPCVVGLKGATEWLNTGDLVRLDGGAGLVERIT